MPKRAVITLHAEFFDRNEENAFRRWAFADDEQIARYALWFVIAFVAMFSINDLLRVGFGSSFLILLVLRILIILTAVATISVIHRFPTPLALDISLTTFQVLGLGLQWFILIGYTSGIHATVVEVLILLAFYLFFPHRFIFRIATALYASLTYIIVDIYFLPSSTVENAQIVATIILANFFGYWYGRRMEALRRINYIELMQERKLRKSVELEIAYRRGLEKELRHSATTDPLTGIYNRRHFLQLGEKELNRSRRYGRPLSVMLIDLDNFKLINDTLGHAAGDEVLKHLSKIISHNLRSNDIFGRLGGDEFSVITPELNCEETKSLAERLRTSVEGPSAKDGPEITISIGVASFAHHDATIEDILSRADKALYTSKKLGRNKVACN